jgi:hypothetical protein
LNLPVFLGALATTSTAQVIPGAFLICCWLWRGLKSDHFRRCLRLDWLWRWAWRAARDERRQAGRGFF